MVGEFEARNDSLENKSQKLQTVQRLLSAGEVEYFTNQQALALGLPFGVRQQKARFVFASFDEPLDLLTAVDVMSNHKGFDPGLLSFLLLVPMYDDITPSSTMQGVNGPASIPVEMPCGRGGGQEVVNGGTG